MNKHFLTWYGKEENGLFEGEKELVNTNIPKLEISKELERLGLFDSTFTIYPVKTLEQFSYLAKFINDVFWTDEYDYFVESGVEE